MSLSGSSAVHSSSLDQEKNLGHYLFQTYFFFYGLTNRKVCHISSKEAAAFLLRCVNPSLCLVG